MRRLRSLIHFVARASVRLVACSSLAAVLVGLPAVVVAVVDPSSIVGDSLRESLTGARLDDGTVVFVALSMFVVLWSWFAITALHEAVTVMKWRLAAPDTSLPDLPSGPTRWVRALVRLAMLASMSAGVAVAPTAGAIHASGSGPGVVATPLGDAYVVQPGDCYWDIAESQLGSVMRRSPTPSDTWRYTERLIDLNHPLLGHRDDTLLLPGELVVLPPVLDGPSPETPVPHVAERADVIVEPLEAPAPMLSPVLAEGEVPSTPQNERAGAVVEGSSEGFIDRDALTAAALLSAGALAGLETRRRRRLRAAPIGGRLRLPSLADTRTETLLRRVPVVERVARLDLALRSAAPVLAAHGAAVSTVLVEPDGGVALLGTGSAELDAPWRWRETSGAWWLPPDVALEDLARAGRSCPQPCPTLVQLGVLADGSECYVDLEAVGLLTIDSPSASQILRAIAASLDLSPLATGVRVVTVGVDCETGEGRCEPARDVRSALDIARRLTGSTATLDRGRTTFSLRVGGVASDECEPACIVVDAHLDAADLADLSAATQPGAGIAGAVRAEAAARGWALVVEGEIHVLHPLGLRLSPVGVDPADVVALRSLLSSEEEAIAAEAEVVPLLVDGAGAAEPPWTFMVRALGAVEVLDHDGEVVRFERSKSLELLAWMVHHHRPTRSAARTALWDTDVRDATFANVVSEARRALARRVPPPDGTDWVGRTLSDALPLHSLVVSDASIIEHRLGASAGRSHEDAVELLRPAVQLVEGMPFAGASYVWSDAEGISSSLVLLAVSAAAKLAGHCLALGDVDGVFWATGQGLKVLAGHEELIALRMRAYARSGDLAGVRAEWDRYERALAADPWADSEPSPKLLALRRTLLAPGTAVAG